MPFSALFSKKWTEDQPTGQLHLLINNGDHEVNADGDPDLGLHRVGARPVLVFDAQVS